MSKHQNLSGRINVVTSNPSNPAEGEEWFNSTDGVWVRYDGTKNIRVAMTTTSTSTTTTTSTSTSTTTS